MADQYENLIITTKGTPELVEAATKARAVDQAIKDLKASFAAGNVLLATYRSEIKSLTKEQASLQGQIGKLSGSGGLKGFGSASMQLSYVMQDLVAQNGDLLRGFMAIQNNMPLLVTSFGGTAGLAGAISLMSLAASLAAPLMANVVKEFNITKTDDFRIAIEKLQDRLKVLEEKKIKLSIDYTEMEQARRRIGDIQDAMRAYEEWSRLHTDWEKKSGAEVASVLANAPGGAAASHEKVIAAEQKQLAGASAAEARELEGRLKDAEDSLKEASVPGADPHGTRMRAARQDITAAKLRLDQFNTNLGETAKQNVGMLRKGAEEGDQKSQARLADLMDQSGQEFAAWSIRRRSAANLKADSAREAEAEALKEQLERDQARLKEQHAGEGVARDERKKFMDTHAGLKREYGPQEYEAARADITDQPELHRKPGEGTTAAISRRLQERRAAKGEEQRLLDDSAQRAADDRDELTSKLGEQFLNDATNEQARIGKMRGRQKVAAQDRFGGRLQALADQRLEAVGVSDPERRNELVAQVPAFVQAQTDQRVAQANAMGNITGLGPPPMRENGPELQQIREAYNGAIANRDARIEQLMSMVRDFGAKLEQSNANARMQQQQFSNTGGTSFMPPAL